MSPTKMVAEKDGSMATKKYDKMHQEIVDFILSGNLHSTLIGKVVSLDGSGANKDIQAAEEFAEYVTGFLQKSEGYAKNNVKGK